MAEVTFQTYWAKSRVAPGGNIKGTTTILSGVLIRPNDELTRALVAFGNQAIDQGGKALYRVGESIMTESKRLVPVDTGNLRASGHVGISNDRPYQQEGSSVSVTLGYGGPAGRGYGAQVSGPYVGTIAKHPEAWVFTVAPKEIGYAVAVHERLDVRHKNGQAKYLEQPLLASASQMEHRIAQQLRSELRFAGG